MHRIDSKGARGTRRATAVACALALCSLPAWSSSGLPPGAPAAEARAPAQASQPWPVGTSGHQLTPQALALDEAAPALRADHAYGLAELVDLAQRHNPQTRAAWAQARHAALAAGIAEAAFLPRLGAQLLAGAQAGSGRRLGNGLELAPDSQAWGTSAVLSLQWLLFDGGQRAAGVEAAGQALAAANIGFTASHQALIQAVCLAFYAHDAARAHLRHAEQALDNARAIEAAAQARWGQGVGTVLELAQARQATAQARLVLVRAQGATRQSFGALVAATGLPPHSEFQVARIEPRRLGPELLPALEPLLHEGLARRPDLQSAQAAWQASRAGVRAAQAELQPKVYLAGSASYSRGELGLNLAPPLGAQALALNGSARRLGSTWFIGLSLPLYDGQTREAVVGQARAMQDKAAAQLEQLRNQAVSQLLALHQTLQTDLAALEASEALESAARLSYEAALDAYRQGVGTVTAASEAQTQWLLAQNAGVDARMAVLSSVVSLALASGTLGAAPS